MHTHGICICLVSVALASTSTPCMRAYAGKSAFGSSQTKTMSIMDLRDRIAGGWAGKMIGVSFGAPTEFRAQGKTYEEKLAWEPGRVNNSLQQNDIYVQLSFMMTMDRYGVNAPAEKFAESFASAGYPLWHANAQARKNFFDGVMPPLSGSPEYNSHADDIDFQIEADYIGFMCPGMPRTAGKLADKVGHIMNYGDGVYGGMFVGALYTHAFFETNIEKIVDEALRSIPAKSEYALCIRDVVLLHRRFPDDWRAAWRRLETKWSADDICGALQPFNIDAKLNGAYIVMGLLYGDGDFGKTMEISLRCGQDSDCNPSNAAAVIGVIKGMKGTPNYACIIRGPHCGIPDDWKRGIAPIADSLFIFTGYTFATAVENTLKYAKQLIAENGGKVTDTSVTIRLQEPRAPKLEQSFPRVVPDRFVPHTDASWRFTGDWGPAGGNIRAAEAAGATATFTFTGTGVAVTGEWSKHGGRADVYVDGRMSRTIDVWFRQGGMYPIWQTFKLKPGTHTVRIVVAGEKRPESAGARIAIGGATVFKTGKKAFEGIDVTKME